MKVRVVGLAHLLLADNDTASI